MPPHPMTHERITVERILRKLGAGRSVASILEDHPHLSEADVFAAARYAADSMAHGRRRRDQPPPIEAHRPRNPQARNGTPPANLSGVPEA